MYTINLTDIKRIDLLKLPHRKWDEPKIYDNLLIISSGKIHSSSKYKLMNIIGCNLTNINKMVEAEIAATCDDIGWIFPNSKNKMLRTDCLHPSNIIHMWGNKIKFEVGINVSSTDIMIVDKCQQT